jgi:adenylate cyclase
MRTRMGKAIILGFIVGSAGLVLGLLSFVFKLEEEIGLHILFKLRGPKTVPSEVVVISIDKDSADALHLPNDLRKWPRSLHARLIDNLTNAGASVISFDLIFDEIQTPRDDALLAEAVGRAKNVVLFQRLRSESVPLSGQKGAPAGSLNIVKAVSPIPVIADSAVALAPFPLPKVPNRVNQFWTFKAGAGDDPTLPIVAFQIYTLPVYRDFLLLLDKTTQFRERIKELPRTPEILTSGRNADDVVRSIRNSFESDPQLGMKMLKELERSQEISSGRNKEKLLKALIHMYQGPSSMYLNFYGPPRMIPTIPYYKILQLNETTNTDERPDLKNKAIFVGLSERLQPEQKDGYYTVFSRSDGLDINGVEIAATAFANLIEDKPIQPVAMPLYMAVLFFGGLTAGVIFRFFPTVISAIGVIVLGILYLVFALYRFKAAGIWYPVFIPLFIQLPGAFIGALLWRYIDVNRERKNMRTAIGYYLPDNVIDMISRNVTDLSEGSQLVYGICLYTDAGQYSALSERVSPKELNMIMNVYYEALFKPVKKYGGVISNVVGDSMLSLWIAAHPDQNLRNSACLAALDIETAVNRFNQAFSKTPLQTRISLHSGHILIGNIGAIDHYEYRPIGDIVNTTTRIDNLNKFLGTHILVSDTVISQLEGFLTREVGEYLLAGKTQTIVAYELRLPLEDAKPDEKEACTIFTEALQAFRRRSWNEAGEKFREAKERFGNDRLSDFYMNLCEQYRTNEPENSWKGVIPVEKQ